jgi:single-strand DNA-binding protein
MSLNRAILIGRLTKQPELRITPGGVSVTNFILAVDRPPKDGTREADFLDCVAFGKLAELVAKHLDKGRLVAVEGRIQTRTYETKDGQRRKVWEVVAESVRFLDRKPREEMQDESPMG